jgi:chromosome segregation ATPase
MKMSKVKILGLGLMLYATLGLAAVQKSPSGKLYKWVDDNGETHYGEVIPPEYADRDKTQLNKFGIEVKDKSKDADANASVKTPEEQAAIDRRRKDNALLNTYSNEKEIDLARNRNLQQVEALISSIQLQLKSARDSQNDYNQELARLQKAKKNIPESLQSDVDNANSRVAELEGDLKEAQDKAASVRAAFDADKVRFHELTVGPVK